MSGISNRSDWSSRGRATAAARRRRVDGGWGPWSDRSARRDHCRAGAGHLREILALRSLPVERDPLPAGERAVRAGSVEPPRPRTPAGTAAAAGAGVAGRRDLSGLDAPPALLPRP